MDEVLHKITEALSIDKKQYYSSSEIYVNIPYPSTVSKSSMRTRLSTLKRKKVIYCRPRQDTRKCDEYRFKKDLLLY